MERLLVFEVNELPLRVVDWWTDRTPDGALAQLVARGTLSETELDERLPRDLYPSQSWASLATGRPWEDHGIFWYGDPKPAEHPLYWQTAAAAGRTVGFVGTLHSSPIATQAADPSIVFAIPDSFGDELQTIPADLGELHRLNARLTGQAARVARVRPGLTDVRGVASFARHGVRPSTWIELTRLAAGVGSGRWNRERLRAGQVLLQADVFEAQMRRFDPDLGILFTNHVASAMHRYWAATFPEDWDSAPYGPAWQAAHADELPYAMRTLDRVLERLLALADRTDRTLVMMSSMGQQADHSVDSSVRHQAVIRDPGRFLEAAGITPAPEVRGSMVPQLTVAVPDGMADQLEASLSAWLGEGLVETMRASDSSAGETLTVTYRPECRADAVFLGAAWHAPADVGMSIEAITDHRSGCHSPFGVFASSRREGWPSRMDAFAVAPTLLELLDVPTATTRHLAA